MIPSSPGLGLRDTADPQETAFPTRVHRLQPVPRPQSVLLCGIKSQGEEELGPSKSASSAGPPLGRQGGVGAGADELAASAVLSSSCTVSVLVCHVTCAERRSRRRDITMSIIASHGSVGTQSVLSRTVSPSFLPSPAAAKMASWHDESACSRFDSSELDGLTACLSCGSAHDAPVHQEALASLSPRDTKIYEDQPSKRPSETRLFLLAPGDGNEPIRWELTIVRPTSGLSSRPSFILGQMTSATQPDVHLSPSIMIAYISHAIIRRPSGA